MEFAEMPCFVANYGRRCFSYCTISFEECCRHNRGLCGKTIQVHTTDTPFVVSFIQLYRCSGENTSLNVGSKQKHYLHIFNCLDPFHSILITY